MDEAASYNESTQDIDGIVSHYIGCICQMYFKMPFWWHSG